jgi:hypothetical protein
MMILIALICFLHLKAIILLVVRGESARSVTVASITIAGGPISLVITTFTLEQGTSPIPREYSNADLLALKSALAACFLTVWHPDHIRRLLRSAADGCRADVTCDLNIQFANA